MKKILETITLSILSITILLSMFLYGCDTNIYHWQFEKSVSEVQQISIIYIDDYYAEDILNLPPIKTIEKSEYENLYNEIKNIGMKKIVIGFELNSPRKYCFLIDYGNGDYCIISEFASGNLHYYKDRNELVYLYAKLEFIDGEAYAFLVNKYLDK